GHEIPHSHNRRSILRSDYCLHGRRRRAGTQVRRAGERARAINKKLESLAARMPDSLEEFVGALAFPGQLMVVWAKTTAPSVVNEKLMRKDYKEVYIDLNSASVLESRHFVTDLGPDGLRAKPEQKQGPADSHDAGAKSMRFDGNWREDKMSEADYMKAHAEADAAYAKAVQALIDEIKKPG